MQELYEQYKGLLFTLAYQLTGSTSDAEDVVQDVFLKIYEVDLELVVEPKAYLCKMVTHRCWDLLKSARKKREQYFGPWLPEPILTSNDESFEFVVRKEMLFYSMLVLLERLSLLERAVFVLREAFGFEYSDIAEMINKSETNCRKMLSRAKVKIGITNEQQIHGDVASEAWVHRFITALEQNNVNAVVSMLAEDVVLVSDGGGKVSAAVHPITSRDLVTRFLLGLVRKSAHEEEGIQVAIRELNGQTGVVIQTTQGVETVVLMHVEGDLLRHLYFVRNPEKLNHVLHHS
ncbi:RNA polymerase sigma-70 factor (ECF subfamily) [Paenibacillus shirakamiensis]|uniref:RNA polymerase sigma-70 factor (ECF subfamily) n=1 Tax=Paenibacillus shirakamiensis TaxID=1265935 RepID=A0ABS4JGL4_9BACL|nr:RNA polymerase sigma-70 factor (ECF subfamily) [Paenibacillus shirakamiensis]